MIKGGVRAWAMAAGPNKQGLSKTTRGNRGQAPLGRLLGILDLCAALLLTLADPNESKVADRE